MTRGSPSLWALRTAFRTMGAVAPEVAARWAETIFCTPPRPEPRTGEPEFLAGGARFTVRSEGQELAAWKWGTGRTIVLVHGWGGRAGRWSAVAAGLVERGFQVVAYDAPAHGASTGRFASLPEFAKALRAVADAVGPVHGLVGHSLGGAAVSIALRDGLVAERAVLLAAPADVVVFSHTFAETLRIPARVRQTMQRNLEARLQTRWEELHIPTVARQLRLPVLVVHDREDADVPYHHGEEIAHAWPHARLVTTTGLGHRGLMRDPAVVRQTVEFLGEGTGR